MKRTISGIIACCIIFTALLPAITASAEADDNVNQAICNFCSDLFKRTYRDGNSGRNMIVSPLSLYADVAMLDNGAVNNTQSEILSMLQSGDSTITQADLNEYFKQYMAFTANGDTVNMANLIYFSDSDNIMINENFVNTAKDYYNADVFTAPPNNDTIDRINNWASENTNRAIDKVVGNDDVNPDTVSVLLNAIAFNGVWENKFADDQIRKKQFSNYTGSTTEVEFLSDTVDSYYQDDNAVAFTRPYDGNYEFIGILPNEEIGVDKYIETMDGSTIDNLLANRLDDSAKIMIPKFEFDNDLDLKSTMIDMGMPEAFMPGTADFSELVTADNGSPYISKVKQLTHVKLDENGTKAEAVTVIIMSKNAVALEDYEIYLDRPFVFVIYDKVNKMPLFIGTVCDMSDNASENSYDTDVTADRNSSLSESSDSSRSSLVSESSNTSKNGSASESSSINKNASVSESSNSTIGTDESIVSESETTSSDITAANNKHTVPYTGAIVGGIVICLAVISFLAVKKRSHK